VDRLATGGEDGRLFLNGVNDDDCEEGVVTDYPAREGGVTNVAFSPAATGW
jgi:hypothetical protein